MIVKDDAETTLIELSTVTDVYADGLHRVELLGDNIRIVYFRWKMTEDGTRWRKVSADVAIIIPHSSLKRPLDQWAPVSVVAPPSERPERMN